MRRAAGSGKRILLMGSISALYSVIARHAQRAEAISGGMRMPIGIASSLRSSQ